MKAVFLRAGALILVASLGACATGESQRGADVTRFHLNQPIARGQIAIEAANPADTNSIEFRSYTAAVGRQLSRLGWNIVNGTGRSEQVALIDVEQGSRQSLGQRSPVTVGVGGSTGGWRSGVGVGATFGLGRRGASEIVSTLLEVKIKRRSDSTVFWEGRATTDARASSPEAQRAIAVEKLADALFRDFPGESGRTIRVR